MTTRSTLGKRIAQARLRAGADRGKAFTQTELAKAVGVTSPTVSQWEADASEPELAMIQRVADALKVDAGWLAFGRPHPAEPHAVRATVKTYTPEEIAAFKRIVAESEGGAQATDDPPRRRRSSGS